MPRNWQGCTTKITLDRTVSKIYIFLMSPETHKNINFWPPGSYLGNPIRALVREGGLILTRPTNYVPGVRGVGGRVFLLGGCR